VGNICSLKHHREIQERVLARMRHRHSLRKLTYAFDCYETHIKNVLAQRDRVQKTMVRWRTPGLKQAFSRWLGTKEEEIRKLSGKEEEAGRLSFEVERYKGLLHDAQDNATRLEVKRAQIEEEIGAMQAAREEDAKRLAAGEERVVHLLGRLGTLEEEATSARAAVSGAEAKAVVLAESEARQVLSAKLESAEAERGRAGVELEQTKLLLRGSDAERAGLEEEASRLRAQVARTEEERTRMEEESVSLKAQLEEAGQELACNVTRVAHHTLESVFAQVGKLDVCLKMSQDCVGLVLSRQDKLSMLLSECQQNIVALQNTLEQVEAEKAQARQQVREQKEKSVRQAEELVAALEREHEWEAEREKALTDRAAALDLVEELNEHIKCVDVEMCGKVSN
jgi:chromosome segregation ATPase